MTSWCEFLPSTLESVILDIVDVEEPVVEGEILEIKNRDKMLAHIVNYKELP
jgi:hypothetical protein